MGKCSVKSCFNRNDKLSPKKVKVFYFPKNKQTKDKWLKICSKNEENLAKNAFICEEHFEDSDYKTKPEYLQNCVNYSPKRRRIKDDAIPTKNLPADAFVIRSTYVDQPQLEERNELNKSAGLLKQRLIENSDIEELKKEIRKLEEEKKKLINENQRKDSEKKEAIEQLNSLKLENNTLKKNLKRLQKKNNEANNKVQKLEKLESAVKDVLTEKQIHKIQNQNLQFVHWDPETVSRAITISSFSGAAYKFLQKINYPLPSKTCLRRWASQVNIQEGVLHDVLYMMEIRGKGLEQHQKIVILSFDELNLQQRMDIDKKREQVIGPHKTVQVCIARGLYMNWKQPIFYKYDQELTSEIVVEVITELWRTGYIVVGVVTDLGGNNPQAFKTYNIGIEKNQKCYFTHPCNDKLNVYVFADVPHLFKLFRNHYLDDGGYHITEECENGTITTKVINKKVIEEMLNKEEKSDLKIAYKLTQEQLDVHGAKRKRMKLSTKLISRGTARAIRWYGNANLLSCEDWEVAAAVFELMNDWFDVFNSKLVYGYDLGQEAYGINLARQNKILEKVTDLMYVIEFGKQDALRPFQKGIILNNTSLKLIFKYLQDNFKTENFKPTYILTNRLNQDCLENLFSIIQAMGQTHGIPSALDFQFCLKSYILGKHAEVIFSRSKNVEDNNDNSLVGLNERKQIITKGQQSIAKDIPNLIIYQIEELTSEVNEDDDVIILNNSSNDVEEDSDKIMQDIDVEIVDDINDMDDGNVIQITKL